MNAARIAVGAFAVISCISAVVWICRLRLNNPDMTETRLGLEYPGQCLSILALFLVSALAFKLVDET